MRRSSVLHFRITALGPEEMQLEQLDFNKLAKVLVALALPAAFCCAHAQDARDEAEQAALADGVSTAAVLMTGAVSVNPIVPIVSFGMKAATLEYTRRL